MEAYKELTEQIKKRQHRHSPKTKRKCVEVVDTFEALMHVRSNH